MESTWQITQETKVLPKLNKPIFIEGLPGIGNVGKIAVDYLVEGLKAKRIYSFFSYKFPHSVFVSEKNLIEMPRIEIFYKKSTGKGRDFLFLVGDIQPIDEDSCYSFCNEILTIIKQYNCSEVITTGGIGLQTIPDTPKIYCTSNDAELLKQYHQKSKILEKEIFGVVGPIVGVSGVLLGFGQRQGVKGVALLAETYGHPLYLGIKGAKEILKIIDKRFSLKINLQKVDKDILSLEKELLKKTAELSSEILHSTSAGAKARDKDVNYIG